MVNQGLLCLVQLPIGSKSTRTDSVGKMGNQGLLSLVQLSVQIGSSRFKSVQKGSTRFVTSPDEKPLLVFRIHTWFVAKVFVPQEAVLETQSKKGSDVEPSLLLCAITSVFVGVRVGDNVAIRQTSRVISIVQCSARRHWQTNCAPMTNTTRCDAYKNVRNNLIGNRVAGRLIY